MSSTEPQVKAGSDPKASDAKVLSTEPLVSPLPSLIPARPTTKPECAID